MCPLQLVLNAIYCVWMRFVIYRVTLDLVDYEVKFYRVCLKTEILGKDAIILTNKSLI